MAASSLQSLAGTLLVDDGTCTTGAVPIYKPDGSVPQKAPSRPASGLGGTTAYVTLLHGRNDDGSVLATTNASGTFAVANTTGTSLALNGNAAKNNTKTDKVLFEVTVPQFYNAGDNITATVNALYAANGGTVGTKTIAATAYLLAKDGTSSANLIATSAATLTTSAADYAFTITGTTLTPGARVIVEITSVLQETANAGSPGIVGTINSVRLS